MTPKLFIFDCDGTLVDSQHRIVAAMGEAFGAHGLVVPAREKVLGIVGLSLIEAVRTLSPELESARHVRLAESYKAAFFELRRSGRHEEPLYEGAEACLRALAGRDDVLLGIATGKSRRGVSMLLEKHGFDGLFQTIQTADTHPSKPHPSMIREALSETGVDPRDAVMIGDTRYDMAMARSAGVAGLGVAWGYHPPSELVVAGAAAVAAHFDEVAAHLDALTAGEARAAS
ncbi:MAG: HAD-IA family hydrolase [Flavobacteriaceae bacterium]